MGKKQKGKPSIKIKINGEAHDYNEEVMINHWQTADEETSAAADEPAEEEEFDWVLPETDVKEVPKFQKVNYVTKRKTPFFIAALPRKFAPGFPALMIAIITAIAVGLLLGFLLLKMMDDVEPKSAALGEETAVAENTTVKPVEEAPASYSMELPSFAASVLQANMYKAAEGAEQSSKELLGKGIASTILSMDGKHYVLIGISNNLTTAKALATQLQSAELEVYAKEIAIKGEEVQFRSEAEATQFVAEQSLFSQLAGEVANGQLTGKVSADVLAEVEKVLQAGSGEINEEEKISKLHSKLVTAHTNLAGFSNAPEDVTKTKGAQQALLEYIVLYHSASS